MADGTGTIDVLNATAQTRLKSVVERIERIERLEEDRRAIVQDLAEVYLQAKGDGFDVKVLRQVVRLRAQDKARRQEEAAILELYLSAIGGL